MQEFSTKFDGFLHSHICWEGKWGNEQDAKCKYISKYDGIDKCGLCNSIVTFFECYNCGVFHSLCLLVKIMIPDVPYAYHLCLTCFKQKKQIMIEMCVMNITSVKDIQEPLRKWLDDNWDYF